MLVQVYEISSPEEARALGELGVDHVGVLVGDGSFPREQSVDRGRLIFSAISPSSKAESLLLSADVQFYRYCPLPSNYLFIAHGLTSLPIVFVALPFLSDVWLAMPSGSRLHQ